MPGELLEVAPRVRGRIGVDRAPVDVTAEVSARLLRSFVWPDQHWRLELLDAAIAAVGEDPPELVRGDFVELLPDLLARRSPDGLTVVFETAVLGYLDSAGRARVSRRARGRRRRRAARVRLESPSRDERAGLAGRGGGGRRPRRLSRRLAGVAPMTITSRDNDKLKLARKLHERRWRDKLGLFLCEGEDLVETALGRGARARRGARRRGAARAGRAAALGRSRRPGAARRGLHPRAPAARDRGVPARRTCRGSTSPRRPRSASPSGASATRATSARSCARSTRSARASSRCRPAARTRPGRRRSGRRQARPFACRPAASTRRRAGGSRSSRAAGSRSRSSTPVVPTTYVLGAEREGLPKEVLARCDVLATIPQSGPAESLNVAMAGTVALYEATRRV